MIGLGGVCCDVLGSVMIVLVQVIRSLLSNCLEGIFSYSKGLGFGVVGQVQF